MRFYLSEIQAHIETKREGPRIDDGATLETFGGDNDFASVVDSVAEKESTE